MSCTKNGRTQLMVGQSSLSRALLLEFAREAWHGRRTGSRLILILVSEPARVVTAFESFIHREGLDNFEREITIYNPSLRGLD
jgi:hypothetical protein